MFRFPVPFTSLVMYPTDESVTIMTITTVTARDFATGLLAGLARENFRQIPTRELGKKFEWSLIGSYQFLSTRGGAILEFDIEKSIEHVIAAVQNGLGHVDRDGVLHIDIERDYTDIYFENLPLKEELWRGAAKALLERLELSVEQ